MSKTQMTNAETVTRGDAGGYAPYMDQNDLGSRRGLITPDLAVVEFGAVDADDANGIAESQTVTGAGTAFVLNGDLVSGGVATFDVPRNVVAAWTNTAVITITGTDQYGETLVESSASGTSHTGKKAFKTITSVTTSATITGATVGSGDVLGLPFYLADKGKFISLSVDGLPEEPTVVAGVTTTATATTGDTRGTIAPATGPDGTAQMTVLMLRKTGTGKENFFGVAQYGG